MQIQTNKATRVLVQCNGKTLSTWSLIADGANMVAVSMNVIQYRAGDVLPVSWADNDLLIGSRRYRVTARLPDGDFIVVPGDGGGGE